MSSLLQRRPKATPIGLDVGEAGVRAVQLRRIGDSYRILGAARAELPVGHDDTEDDDRRGVRVRAAIKDCLRKADFRGRIVTAALSSPDIEFHALELPDAGEAELTQIVRIEVKRLMAEPRDKIETRHWRLPETRASAPNAIGVAVAHEKVVEIVDLCDHAGAECGGVDSSATALVRFGCLLSNWTSEQIWGVLDLGHRQARLTLCVDDVPVLARAIGAGGATLTERIAEALGTSVKTAEIQKLDHGIALKARGVRAESGGPPDSQLASVLLGILRNDLNDMASEIKRSYEYVLGCYPSRHAADLVLVGGGAGMRNLSLFLAGSLGIAVHPASDLLRRPTCRLKLGPGRTPPLESAALAVGLAIGD